MLITGAASGIGIGRAKGFARRGANLVLTDVNLSGLEKAAIAVRTPTLKALTLRCDVGDDASVAACTKALDEAGVVLDVCRWVDTIDPSNEAWKARPILARAFLG